MITSPPCAPRQKDIKRERLEDISLQAPALDASKMTSATWHPTHFWMAYGNFPEVLPGYEKLPD